MSMCRLRLQLAALAALLAIGLAAPNARAATEDAVAARSGIPTPRATVIDAPCPYTDDEISGVACAYSDTATIYAPHDEGAFILEHELGHIFDVQYLDDGERHALVRALGLTAGPWDRGSGLDGGNTSPIEWFADAYAACRLRLDPRHKWETAYDYQPSAKRHRKVCGIIRRASVD